MVSVFRANAAMAEGWQHQNGSAYFWWSGNILRSDSAISQSIKIYQLSPQMYWSTAWHWANAKDGGYGGLQTQGLVGNGVIADIATFSIWNATEGIPGPGANCLPFGGEGVGFSCRLPIDLVANRIYTMSYSLNDKKTHRWWTAKVTDEENKKVYLIGKIKAPKANLRSKTWYNFIEYWGAQVKCEEVGEASAKFYNPVSSNPKVKPTFEKFLKASNYCVNVEADTPKFGEQGNPVMRFGGLNQTPSTIQKAGR